MATTLLVFFGYPLHPPKKPSILRAEHFGRVTVPMLFLQGDRDALAEMALLRPLIDGLGQRSTLEVVEGGDHGFHVPKRTGRTDAAALGIALDGSGHGRNRSSLRLPDAPDLAEVFVTYVAAAECYASPSSSSAIKISVEWTDSQTGYNKGRAGSVGCQFEQTAATRAISTSSRDTGSSTVSPRATVVRVARTTTVPTPRGRPTVVRHAAAASPGPRDRTWSPQHLRRNGSFAGGLFVAPPQCVARSPVTIPSAPIESTTCETTVSDQAQPSRAVSPCDASRRRPPEAT